MVIFLKCKAQSQKQSSNQRVEEEWGEEEASFAEDCSLLDLLVMLTAKVRRKSLLQVRSCACEKKDEKNNLRLLLPVRVHGASR